MPVLTDQSQSFELGGSSLQEGRLLGIDWVLRQVLMNLLMQISPVVYLRKRLFSRQNNPLARIGLNDGQWQAYRDAIADAKLAVEGADILEIGPGPILANGVRFIAEGAKSYTALDRFDLLRRDPEVKQAYRELIALLPYEQQQRCPGLIAEQNGALFDQRIKSIVAKIEDALEKVGLGQLDFIVSFDVLEHVDDLATTMRTIRRLLRPGGVMIHRVDVTVHNAPSGIHRLAHLTFSESTWQLISSNRAVCNRIRPSEFLAVAERQGFETLHFQPTRTLTPESIAAIRPKLSDKFARCAFDDLAVLDFVWIARSPT
jgi:SAM-dependent methyltransferase